MIPAQGCLCFINHVSRGKLLCQSVPRVPLNVKMPTSIVSLALTSLIAVYNVAQVSCGDQCFNIDEIQQPEYFPCSPSAPTSNCCQSDWICLSNGLCEPDNNPRPNPVVWTGLCTDPYWGNTTACAKICQNNLTGTYSSGSGVRDSDLESKEWLTLPNQLSVLTIVYHRAEKATSPALKTTTAKLVAVLSPTGFS